MQHSGHRILTTHTGSLPRPAGLTQLYSRHAGTKEAVSSTTLLPAAIGPVAYADPRAIEAECDDLAAALAPVAGRYAETF